MAKRQKVALIDTEPTDTSELNPADLLDEQEDSSLYITLTEDQLRIQLKQMANLEKAGVNGLAGKLGVTGQFLGDVLAGKKGFGHTIIDSLGAKRLVLYQMPVSIDQL
jgi:hypothetical protein